MFRNLFKKSFFVLAEASVTALFSAGAGKLFAAFHLEEKYHNSCVALFAFIAGANVMITSVSKYMDEPNHLIGDNDHIDDHY